MNITFDLPKEQASIIKVVGVGGGGSNAVNHMFQQGIRGVNFVICNTDAQAMELSPIPNKIQLGPSLTKGLGAGSYPEVGKKSAEESVEEVRALLEKNTKMVFVTAGMGGGTGTGGAPVIAKLAKEMGILTVGIVTTPFYFEGKRKLNQAKVGIEELRQNVDSIIIISNDKIREIYGNLTRSDAFAKADNILAIAARSISEIITVAGQVNVDFADVQHVMKNSGVAIMGSAYAEGEDRARKAIESALSSPLINDNNIIGAQKILLNITSGSGKNQVTIDEIDEISDYIRAACGSDTDMIFGTCDDEALGEKISVTVIATGFEEKELIPDPKKNTTKVVLPFDDRKKPQPKIEDDATATLFDKPVVIDLDVNVRKPETTHQSQEPVASQPVQKEPAFVPPVEKTITPPPPPAANDGFVITVKQEKNEPLQQPQQPSRSEQQAQRATMLTSHNYRTPQRLSDLENEPAYKRRNIQLGNMPPHSSESAMSRLTLTDDKDDGSMIKKNNSFLHDNVD